MTTTPADDLQPHLDALAEANRAFARRYPGDAPARQPIHTVYGGAHLYKAETTRRLGELALAHLTRWAPDAVALARAVGFGSTTIADGLDPAALRVLFDSDAATLLRESP